MKEAIGLVILGALFAGLKAGLKSYRKKGKIDGSVIADGVEAIVDAVDRTNDTK